jgi:hypothetical protein
VRFARLRDEDIAAVQFILLAFDLENLSSTVEEMDLDDAGVMVRRQVWPRVSVTAPPQHRDFAQPIPTKIERLPFASIHVLDANIGIRYTHCSKSTARAGTARQAIDTVLPAAWRQIFPDYNLSKRPIGSISSAQTKWNDKHR